MTFCLRTRLPGNLTSTPSIFRKKKPFNALRSISTNPSLSGPTRIPTMYLHQGAMPSLMTFGVIFRITNYLLQRVQHLLKILKIIRVALQHLMISRVCLIRRHHKTACRRQQHLLLAPTVRIPIPNAFPIWHWVSTFLSTSEAKRICRYNIHDIVRSFH